MIQSVLVTGATGYIGKVLCESLVAKKVRVYGLTRTPERSKVLPKGVIPILGNFADPTAWFEQVNQVDVIINTGFPNHGKDWFQAVEMERIFLTNLFGSCNQYFQKIILLNGTAFLGDSGLGKLDENQAPDPDHPAFIRAHNTSPGYWKRYTHKIVEVRLASFVYGLGGSVFLPILINHAKQTGQSIYVGEGQTKTSTLHVSHAATACIAAMTAPGGSTYHFAQEETPSAKQIAQAVAIAVGHNCEVISVDYDTAVQRLDAFTALFLTQNNVLDSQKARRELNWSGDGKSGLLWDVAYGSYGGQKVKR